MTAVPAHGPFPLPRSARIAVFASGRGSNLASLLTAFPPRDEANDAPLGTVTLVLGNVPGAAALQRAADAGVPTRTVAWRRGEGDRETFEAAAQDDLDAHGIDLVCLAGFMRVLSPGFVRRWEGRIVNVHPSLLPAFRGLHAQRQALRAGVRESGCTIHLVDAGVDTGRVLLQRRVPVHPDDTERSLADRILNEEHAAYPEAVRRLLRGEVPDRAADAAPAKEETA
ncbi:MAG: phosphoribosylglycinamide formyltransferase [Deinococcus-Thermus bacterium]|nr:phosphoribosylglycinamide formyltransferase [Deinococcota bacterium]